MAFTPAPRDDALAAFNRASRELPETGVQGLSRAAADAMLQAGLDAQQRRAERTRQAIRDMGGSTP